MPKMITILGPTASGKTALAAALAYKIGAEIISADSRQVYSGMTVGTGKDLDDYVVNGRQIKYHLIDIARPGDKYNIYEYQRDFHKVYAELAQRGVMPILCGGSGLYIETVLKGYSLSTVPQNPELRQRLSGKTLEELTEILVDLKARNNSCMHNRSDVDTAQRAVRAIEIEEYNLHHPSSNTEFPPVESVIIGVDIDRESRRARITERLRQRLEHGLVEEVEGLLESGVSAEDLIYYGLEYKYVTEYVTGRTTRDEMFKGLEIAIHQFAKRQMTWFRGMERRGFTINWVDWHMSMDEKLEYIMKLIVTQS
ncbi:tRNA (adenosine(37)-N6)-dimethylallyltransferase MiaA [Prevotella sp. HCN-7019]|uniref:tRNA (adenosine(37)-N6)-dimethylallyltransferase MiaA n=1 Tax=Prevotella sp. HCN-7019 TaxID=3134668 RepID=UPI00260C8CB1